MGNLRGFNEVSEPLFATNPSEAEAKEGEAGKAEHDRNQRSSPVFPDPAVNDK
jgi:hypothetical protein